MFIVPLSLYEDAYRRSYGGVLIAFEWIQFWLLSNFMLQCYKLAWAMLDRPETVQAFLAWREMNENRQVLNSYWFRHAGIY